MPKRGNPGGARGAGTGRSSGTLFSWAKRTPKKTAGTRKGPDAKRLGSEGPKPMSTRTANKLLNDRDMRKAGKSTPKPKSKADPRDTPKYGVTGTRRYSTKGRHGTGRGSRVI